MAGFQQSGTHKVQVLHSSKPIVIGIYGIPGCGKSFLLKQLARELGTEQFALFEGSENIDAVTPGGLPAFKQLDDVHQEEWRQQAIKEVRRISAATGKAAVVAGHFMFWNEEEEETGTKVWTNADAEVYTHILYLQVPASIVVHRCESDLVRNRPCSSVSHLDKWQQIEISELRSLCLKYEILFTVVPEHLHALDGISTLLRDFQVHSEKHNLLLLETELDGIIAQKDHVEIVLVFDADGTLTAEDTGVMFWNRAGLPQPVLKNLFGSSMQQTYKAFRQAMLLHEEKAIDFEKICEEVSEAVVIYPYFISLMRHLAEYKYIEVIVITCGLRRVWEMILQREDLSEKVKVIGGGRLADGFVVSGKEKGALVKRLQNVHGKYVWSFGDSPLDLEMLCQANQAIIVVGDEKTRSESMDTVLEAAIQNGLVARQAVLFPDTSPRADTKILPVVDITDNAFYHSITRRRKASNHSSTGLLHATNSKAAELLMTPMRDSSVSGPPLRAAHRLVGWYLAAEFLTSIIGLERYSIRHVQGHKIDGFRLANEERTTLVALMRGGEPMAQGVNDAFPRAMLVHAKFPADIKPHHLDEQSTVVLVDSVINTGKSVVEFVRYIRKQLATVLIVVVAGVVQAQSVSHGDLAQMLVADKNLSIVALRLSENKFTGRSTTDTGNRLFNTTRLE